MDTLNDLKQFYENIITYQKLIQRWHESSSPSAELEGDIQSLRAELQRSYSRLENTITSYAGLSSVTAPVSGNKQNMFYTAFDLVDDYNITKRLNTLNKIIPIVNKAIGKLEAEGKSWEVELPKKPEKVTKQLSKDIAYKPKAFIAHEGETEALAKLTDFLIALRIEPVIAEKMPSDSNLVEPHVIANIHAGDVVIILATKGKAINKTSGKSYMGLNVADELGRAREAGKKVILLLEKDVDPHTNISGIAYETFTPESMDKAFTKIARELTNWGYVKSVRIDTEKK